MLWFSSCQGIAKQEADGLKKRKLITPETRMSYKLTKGPKFALQRKRAATDLTHDMLQRSVTTSLSCARILQYFYIHSPLLSCHPFCCPQSQALTCCQAILGSYLCSLPFILSVLCKQASGRLLFSHIRLAHQHTDIVISSCVGPFIVPYWSQEKFQLLILHRQDLINARCNPVNRRQYTCLSAAARRESNVHLLTVCIIPYRND